MKIFSSLCKTLESKVAEREVQNAIIKFLENVSDKDRIWAVALLIQRRPTRLISTSKLQSWALEYTTIPPWLFEESYQMVGDRIETISSCVCNPFRKAEKSLSEYIDQMIVLHNQKEKDKKSFVIQAWSELNRDECLIFNKLITGSFRINLREKEIAEAISIFLKREYNIIAQCIAAKWSPENTSFQEIFDLQSSAYHSFHPFPFQLALPLEKEIKNKITPENWNAEWMWGGIRIQLMKRNENLQIWSRRHELITKQYPEFDILKELTHVDFVIDGQLLIFKEGKIRPYIHIQKRQGRKRLNQKLLAGYPAAIFAHDLLEIDGTDLRNLTLRERKTKLDILIGIISQKYPDLIFYTDDIPFSNWNDLINIKSATHYQKAKGIILKSVAGTYKNGRVKGEWWKWKSDPHIVNVVLLYAHRHPGLSTNKYSEFTFAAWDANSALVPLAKAGINCPDSELIEIFQFIDENIIDKFGPVRSVLPELVFEMSFEEIYESKRHKSGVVLKNPMIHSWQKKISSDAACKLEDIRKLLF